ncbi:histidinol-phosphatase HisJ family protein [Clostridium sp. 'deep sea']|uniref:histidinol-phosphatase HisJ family protein n=1 Tax=Clostridium sp. 'deep sea' TaxID=2779445 RepID=UPI0018964AA6|nr:histidinol-phosphatase HisJ family protein [Clostridium sp. 'deep sea']QOR34149.1 histidinol-phosphatase HisJ family protein [Clostridium sp. 'deep sea']
MFDYHIHSHFSIDSKMKMEEIIKIAITKQLKEICCTDHIDLDFFYKERPFEFDPSLYFKEFKRLKEIYSSKVTIRSGVEIGLQPHLLERYQKIVTSYNFDFILASVHSVENVSLTKKDLVVKYGATELWQRYFEEMLNSINNFQQFNILGHLDVPKRYNIEMKNSSLKPYHSIIKQIYKTLIANGKGIEVNSAGFHYYGLNDNNPSKDLLKLYYDCGGEIVTFGSDAHNYTQIGKNYYSVINILKDIGFKYICTFKNQQVIFHNIK